jgi:LytS/YehU family sensor histidine kinase
VTLQEEVDTLHLYLELEKMRFQDIEYNIEYEDTINISHIRIPSMIVQPFVENAIKHGLLHKNGSKKLNISFKKITDIKLEIRIEDNGIGRAKSDEINKHKKIYHKSFANEANLKRIELLNRENNEIGVEIIDLYDTSKEPTGTLVIINIPLIDKIKI